MLDARLLQRHRFKTRLPSLNCLVPSLKIRLLPLGGSGPGFSAAFRWSVCLTLHQNHTLVVPGFTINLKVRQCTGVVVVFPSQSRAGRCGVSTRPSQWLRGFLGRSLQLFGEGLQVIRGSDVLIISSHVTRELDTAFCLLRSL